MNQDEQARDEQLPEAEARNESTIAPSDQETHPAAEAMGGAFPKQVGHYEMLGVLGEGGMGVVFKAHDSRLRRDVAFKTIRPSTRQHAFVERLQREARLLAQLDHPHIVRILDFGEEEDRAWLAMELLSGETLADLMRNEQPQMPRAVAELVLQIARAVGYCHTAGIIHRDLKPANVLVDEAGKLKVTDFGLGRSTANESRLTRSGDVVGTLQYMAPEQATGAVKQIRPTSDVYALGVILYELLTGQPPFAEDDPLRTITRILAEEPQPPTKLREEIPAELETICLKCLEKKPAARYANANDLADDLQRYLNNAAIEAKPVSLPERMLRTARRYPVASATTLLTFAFLIIGLFALAAHNRKLQAELERSQRLVTRSREFSNWLLYDFSESMETPQGLTVARAKMIERIVQHLNETLRDAGRDSELRFDLAKAYVRVAHLQGNPESFNLGQTDAAEESLNQAETLFKQLDADPLVGHRVGFMRALVAEARGDIAFSTAASENAISFYNAAISELDRLDDNRPLETVDASEQARRQALRTNLLVGLAEVARYEQRFDAAIDYLDQASKSFTPNRIKEDPVSHLRIELTLAQTLEDASRHKEALTIWERSIAAAEKQTANTEMTVSVEQPLVTALLGKAGSLLPLKRFDEADAAYDRALEINEAMIARDAGNSFLQRERAIVLRDRVILHMSKGKLEKQLDLPWLAEAETIFKRLSEQDPTNHLARYDLISLYGFVGGYHLMSFDPEAAEAAFTSGKSLAESLIRDKRATPGVRQALAEAVRGLGSADSLRMSQAADAQIKAQEAGKPSPAVNPTDFAERAIEHYEESLKLFEQLEQEFGLTEKQTASKRTTAEMLKMHRDILSPPEAKLE